MVERRRAFLSALAETAHVRADAKLDVLVGECSELGDSQPGLDCDGEQGMVASAGPGLAVGDFDQRFDLGPGQVADLFRSRRLAGMSNTDAIMAECSGCRRAA